ncbi:MAG: Nif3-like dinuclear metal center hexameric protein [Flavobacteriales bacterium]
MKIKEVTQFLEKIAPLNYQESYDNSGLLTGNPEEKVKGILTTLDCTEEVIEEAIQKGLNLVVAHHPIIFSGLKKLIGKNYIERTIIKAIKNDIAIYAIHTNLDNIKRGVNFKIADKLGLSDVKVLAPKSEILEKLVVFVPNTHVDEVMNTLFDAGAGHIGEYSECSYSLNGKGTFKAAENTNPHVGEIGERHYEDEVRIEVILPAHNRNKILQNLLKVHPYEEVAYDLYPLKNLNPQVGSGIIGMLTEETNSLEFLKKIKHTFDSGCIKHTHIHKPTLKKVALCGGAGYFLLNDALRENADIFITADYKYHQFFDAENRIIIADIGHFESEQFTSELLLDILTENFSTFAVRLSETKTNPVNYL